MAKTRIDKWDTWSTPSLLISHRPAGSGTPPAPFAFHAIWLWVTPTNYADLCLWTPAPPDWDPYSKIPTEAQLALARLLIANPHLISHSCTYCRQTFEHPWHVVWNLLRGEQYPWLTPACAADGSYPENWTPDQWPPAWWW